MDVNRYALDTPRHTAVLNHKGLVLMREDVTHFRCSWREAVQLAQFILQCAAEEGFTYEEPMREEEHANEAR